VTCFLHVFFRCVDFVHLLLSAGKGFVITVRNVLQHIGGIIYEVAEYSALFKHMECIGGGVQVRESITHISCFQLFHDLLREREREEGRVESRYTSDIDHIHHNVYTQQRHTCGSKAFETSENSSDDTKPDTAVIPLSNIKVYFTKGLICFSSFESFSTK
jgi:hypothetical protein